MTGGSLSTSAGLNSGYVGNGNAGNAMDSKNGVPMPFPGMSAGVNGTGYGMQKGQPENAGLPKKFQNDGMFNAYQPWVIKTYGDLAKTKTITIKKYARILRTLRGEEVNSAENSKFRFWVKSKGFHIGQPEGYDAKPADRIIGRHAVTSPGLDPPLYVPTQLPHNKVSLSLLWIIVFLVDLAALPAIGCSSVASCTNRSGESRALNEVSTFQDNRLFVLTDRRNRTRR